MKPTIALCVLMFSMTNAAADPTEPVLAQAWQAESTGDGEQGMTGLESYLYEEFTNKGGDPNGLRSHIWDYGESCKKIEVDSNNLHHPVGTFYVKCYAVNCCVGENQGPGKRPDVKKWVLAPKSTAFSQVSYLGQVDTTELNNVPVKNAEAWSQIDKIPFTNMKANHTYYITRNGTDVITHRIDYSVSNNKKVPPGSILYGNFTVQHDVASFRQMFMPPAECLKPNVLKCQKEKIAELEKKFFKNSAAEKGLF